MEKGNYTQDKKALNAKNPSKVADNKWRSTHKSLSLLHCLKNAQLYMTRI